MPLPYLHELLTGPQLFKKAIQTQLVSLMLICWIVIIRWIALYSNSSLYGHPLTSDTSLLQFALSPLHFLYKCNPSNMDTPLIWTLSMPPYFLYKGFDWGQVHVAAARKRSHQWCVSLTPKNTKTSGRMTCHCFLV